MATGTTDTSLKGMSAPYFAVPPWTDLRTPVLSSNASGSRPPTLVRVYRDVLGTSQGVFAYSFDFGTIEREVYLSIQLPHSYVEGSNLRPHVHILTTTAADGTTKWGMEYAISNINDFFSGVTTIIQGTKDITSADVNKHLILPFTEIDGTGIKISAVMMIRLFRYTSTNGDTYPASIFAMEFDLHYQSDTVGSRMEYIK